MFNLGLSEMILIAIIALIFIGPKQLPEIARTVGRMLNELKRATDDLTSSITNPRSYSKNELPKITPIESKEQAPIQPIEQDKISEKNTES